MSWRKAATYRWTMQADADLIVLNTCHIREKAAEKVYSELGRLRHLKERSARAGRPVLLAVAGCVAQAEGAELLSRAPYVDIVVGPQTYQHLSDMVARVDVRARSSRPTFRPMRNSTACPNRSWRRAPRRRF